MESEVVTYANQRSSGRTGSSSKLRYLNPSVLLRWVVRHFDSVDSDSTTIVAEERLVSRALTHREQAAYQQCLSAEREAEQSVLSASREGLDRAYSDFKRVTEFALGAGIHEGRRIGHAYRDSRRRTA